MATATVTFMKSDFLSPKRNGTVFTEECWDEFVSLLVNKHTKGEFTSVCYYSEPEGVVCSVKVSDDMVANEVQSCTIIGEDSL